MEDTDVTYELDKMLENSKKEYNITLTEQQCDEPSINTQRRSSTESDEVSDTEINTVSTIQKPIKKIIPVQNNINDLHMEAELTKAKKELLSMKEDMGKIVNIFTQMKIEMDSMKQKINEMESKSGRDDDYHEYVDRTLSVNLDKLKMKLKKSLKKYLINSS